MYKNGTKSGGKTRAPANSEEAAVFRAACKHLGINHTNCHYRLGIGKSMFYSYGNGEMEVSLPVSKLLDSMQAHEKLLKVFEELQSELNTLKGIAE
jgi:hypothetical protein